MSLKDPVVLPPATPALKRTFSRRSWVRLPGLLACDLVARAQERLRAARFVPWKNEAFDVRETPDDDFLNVALPLLLNEPRLFRFVEDVCGVPGIKRLTGRVYRARPAAESGHFCDWHKDSENGRRLASMTIVLGAEPFEGGRLELRPAGGRASRIAYGGPGDAVLFSVSPALEHRSEPVRGRVPKDILAVWFHLD